MFNELILALTHRRHTIKDIRKATLLAPFRGVPLIQAAIGENSESTSWTCPTFALKQKPLQLDLGRCLFCGQCQRNSTTNTIIWSTNYRLATTQRNQLIVTQQSTILQKQITVEPLSSDIHKIFGRSLKLRHVSAGSCNGCELEWNACSNVNFDIGRFGIDIVASPRHADGLIISGPFTKAMASAIEDAYTATPAPKLIILLGTCAISGGLFANSPAIYREFLTRYPINLYIPGCPPHPLTIINGLLDLLGVCRTPSKL